MPLLQNDLDSFKLEFEAGLGRMLSPDGLGAFILVLANSMQDTPLANSLAPALQQTFQSLCQLADSGDLQGGPDDIDVFGQLQKSGIENYCAWESRNPGIWQVAFNPLRALKPERASNVAFESLHLPFNEQAFHFDKPFLKAEILTEETLGDHALRIMYQKFPFVPWHLLMLLDGHRHHPQYLSQAHHETIAELTRQSGKNLPGFGVAFNSIGAGASVNHLHFHGFVQDQLPVEMEQWQHNGGQQPWPVTCQRFENSATSWLAIAECHVAHQPYNLLYRPDCIYLITRPPQAKLDTPDWLPNVTWFELAGGFNLTLRNSFDELSDNAIRTTLERMTTSA